MCLLDPLSIRTSIENLLGVKEIATRFDCPEMFVTEFTPVMGAHTGPGLLGMAFYAE
jgi:fatty acid-binding protein DegV